MKAQEQVAFLFAVLALGGMTCEKATADTFGSGGNLFDIPFVTIGDPGNLGDPTGSPFLAGSVDDPYRIGKYEISEAMIDAANAQSALEGDPLGITHDGRGPNKPVTSVSWFEAARFVNWLNTNVGLSPAYKFDDQGDFQLWTPEDPGYHPSNLFRNTNARYFLPSTDEWYKAAYYDPDADVYFDYPTGSDSVPDGIDFVGDTEFDAVFFDGGANSGPNEITNVGVLSPFGTAGQGGNVSEWNETTFDLRNEFSFGQRRADGGTWATAANVLLALHSGIGIPPTFQGDFIGFRVVHIPEPASLLLLGTALLGLGSLRRAQSQ